MEKSTIQSAFHVANTHSMLSIATSSLSFAGPSALPLARAVPVITMQEGGPPPVFSVIEDQVPMPDPEFDANAFAQTLPGITGPLGFFDPAGFCSNDNGAEGTATEGKVRFYREVEVKHCRVAMLAAFGYPLAEVFHPLFGGGINGPSFSAFQQTPLQTFWPAVVFTIAVIEVLSILPAFEDPNVEGWAIKTTHSPGDLGFDPLGLKPTDALELKEMQSKELNNGRLAMIAIAGMVVQEGVTGAKLF